MLTGYFSVPRYLAGVLVFGLAVYICFRWELPFFSEDYFVKCLISYNKVHIIGSFSFYNFCLNLWDMCSVIFMYRKEIGVFGYKVSRGQTRYLMILQVCQFIICVSFWIFISPKFGFILWIKCTTYSLRKHNWISFLFCVMNFFSQYMHFLW